MSYHSSNQHLEVNHLGQAIIDTNQTAESLSCVDLGAAFTKMLVSLGLIIILLLLSYWFLRKVFQNRLQKGIGSAAIQIIEKRMISPKTMLYIIEVNGKKVLIAESHLEVKRLVELSQEEELEKS